MLMRRSNRVNRFTEARTEIANRSAKPRPYRSQTSSRSRAARPFGVPSGNHGRMRERPERRTGSEFETTLAATASHAPEFLGLTESEAIALAGGLRIQLRVIRDDHAVLSADLRARRITADLRTGG
jgi:hypothetical protein